MFRLDKISAVEMINAADIIYTSNIIHADLLDGVQCGKQQKHDNDWNSDIQ